MSANEKKPSNPIIKAGFPENRQYRLVDGVRLKVGSVINVEKNDSWWSLAKANDIRPWEIIYFNFETYSPEEVNWYLREYVGCHVLGPRGKNYKFDKAKHGRILLPWGEKINKILVERIKKRKEPQEQTLLDKHWSDRKSDIARGKVLIEQMKINTHAQVSTWKPNPLAFDVSKEIKSLIFGNPRKPGLPSVGFYELFESVLKTFNESNPLNQEIRRVRQGMYAAFAAGVATIIVPEERHSNHGMSGYERVFFEKGAIYAKKLTPLKKYQLILALVENDRTYGLKGFNSIEYSKEKYAEHMRSGGKIKYIIRQEFLSKKYFFRN